MATINNENLGSDIKKHSCTAKEDEELVRSGLLDVTRSIQRAIAAMRSNIQDLRAEYSEDIAEVKREMHEVRRNKGLDFKGVSLAKNGN